MTGPPAEAEVDGNRTRRCRVTTANRFEGGGAHQALEHLRGWERTRTARLRRLGVTLAHEPGRLGHSVGNRWDRPREVSGAWGRSLLGGRHNVEYPGHREVNPVCRDFFLDLG